MTINRHSKKIAGFNTTYLDLPESFYVKTLPANVSSPKCILFNTELAKVIAPSLANLEMTEYAQFFSGNTLFQDSTPIATAYAGHQFGSFVSQLGDGRAILLGEVGSGTNRKDIQLKGSGQTPFSRGGDGKSALGPVIREYIVSEAMQQLGIPTTRALALVTTGEKVMRREGMIPGGILTRVASSHLRVGTFEFFTARDDIHAIRQLADYTITRHYPEASTKKNRYLALFEMVCKAQAKLIADWMRVGFIHGVMNTDNTSICGETIDYGPCAFMDEYDPDTTFSSIDMHGRYRFVNQGSIGAWNMSSFGNCLRPLLAEQDEEAKLLIEQTVENFQQDFLHRWRKEMNRKLGLQTMQKGDLDLLKGFLEIMADQKTDYTLSFRYLADCLGDDGKEKRFLRLFHTPEALTPWLSRWEKRIADEKQSKITILEKMLQVNPAFIPRNHRIEQAIQLAERDGDFSLVRKLIHILAEPYTDQPEYEEYMLPPKEEERVLQTFCGT